MWVYSLLSLAFRLTVIRTVLRVYVVSSIIIYYFTLYEQNLIPLQLEKDLEELRRTSFEKEQNLIQDHQNKLRIETEDALRR